MDSVMNIDAAANITGQDYSSDDVLEAEAPKGKRVKTEQVTKPISESGSVAESVADNQGKCVKQEKVQDGASAKDSVAKSTADKGKTLTKDKLTVYMDKTNRAFRNAVVTPAESLQRAIRGIRNSVVSGKYQENQAAFVAKVCQIDEDAGWLLTSAQGHEGRLKTQVQMVAKHRKAKSSGRREAGKSKAVALKQWQQDVQAAGSALKKEGYTGSLNLKKGGALYSKILQLRSSRGTRSASASASGCAVAWATSPSLVTDLE